MNNIQEKFNDLVKSWAEQQSEFVKKMQSEFDQLIATQEEKKQEFKAGDWVKVISNGLTYSTHTQMQGVNGFVFNFIPGNNDIGRFVKYFPLNNCDRAVQVEIDGKIVCIDSKGIINATDSEIESHLIEEKEKEGWVKGANIEANEWVGKIKKLSVVTKIDSSNDSIHVKKYFEKHGPYFIAVHFESGACFPIDMVKLLLYTPEIEINGYKAEFKEWGLSFNNGCAEISKTLFIELSKLSKLNIVGSGNKTIQSVTIGKGTFTVDQIIEIANYYSGNGGKE